MKKLFLILIFVIPMTSFSQNKTKEERETELEAKKTKNNKATNSILDSKFNGSDCGFPIPMPCNEGDVEYQSIISSEKTKNELFDITNQWFSSAFKSGRSVIDYSSKENGKVIGKGYFAFDFFNRGDQSIGFTILLESKDGRLRYTINNLVYYQTASPSFKNISLEKNSWQIENYPKSWGFKTKFYKQVDEGVKKIIANLETFISASEKKSKEEEW